MAAAHNPVLTDPFTEFVPALRRGPVELLGLTALREDEPHHGDASHAALVDAVRRGDEQAAAGTLQEELAATPALFRTPGTAADSR